jgi:hypothetical protein
VMFQYILNDNHIRRLCSTLIINMYLNKMSVITLTPQAATSKSTFLVGDF